MKKLVLFALALAACGQSANQPHEPNGVQPTDGTAPAIPPPATGPDAKTPLVEPKTIIDPKSIEAAGQVVQHYGALIEQRRMKEADELWGSPGASSEFALQLKRYPEVHLEIGQPGEQDGAAGSVYVTVPVTFYGKDRNGAGFRSPADVILRRVNDVPGSTVTQRRWHIERIEWKDAA